MPTIMPQLSSYHILALMALIFLGIVLSTIIQLLLLRVAMFFPPVRHMVRWILDYAER